MILVKETKTRGGYWSRDTIVVVAKRKGEMDGFGKERLGYLVMSFG